MEDPRESFLSRIRHYREEDRHESALINARMGWLINIQAALIIAFFILSLGKNPFFVICNSLFLSLMAVFFAYTITRAIRKAEIMVYEWHMREKQVYKEIEELQNNDLIKELGNYFLTHLWERSEKEDKKLSDSFSFQKMVFPALMLFWSAVLLFSAYNFLEYEAIALPH
jgi:hypothetical protein